MVSRAALTILLSVTAGCATTHRITVRGGDVHRAAPVLRAEGVAEVEATRRHPEGDATERVKERLRLDQTLSVGKRRYTVKALLHWNTPVRCRGGARGLQPDGA